MENKSGDGKHSPFGNEKGATSSGPSDGTCKPVKEYAIKQEIAKERMSEKKPFKI